MKSLPSKSSGDNNKSVTSAPADSKSQVTPGSWRNTVQCVILTIEASCSNIILYSLTVTSSHSGMHVDENVRVLLTLSAYWIAEVRRHGSVFCYSISWTIQFAIQPSHIDAFGSNTSILQVFHIMPAVFSNISGCLCVGNCRNEKNNCCNCWRPIQLLFSC